MKLLKNLGKTLVCNILEKQVRQLRQKHSFTIVAVAGSVGKTSTKLAVADLLASKLRVRWQQGNYNDRVTVPLILFGQDEPQILNVFGWFKIFRANKKILRSEYPYDVVVVELGTDAPGQIAAFAYLEPDYVIVTAVAPEHMEYFGTLDAVAEEELSIFSYAKQVLVNIDDVEEKYLQGRQLLSYSLVNASANYYAESKDDGLAGQLLNVKTPQATLQTKTHFIGQQGAKIVLAAIAVADALGMSQQEIHDGVLGLEAFAGRMQILPGIQNSMIIDDSYNASPAAVRAALDVLYASAAPQKIALLGNMNELGNFSHQAHTDIGDYCDPAKVDLVVTLGSDANKYLAPAALGKGCNVKTCTSPFDAGEYIKSMLKEGAVVLIKGSQNGVFAEEAIKSLLQNQADQVKLVRQSRDWLAAKQKQFGRMPKTTSDQVPSPPA